MITFIKKTFCLSLLGGAALLFTQKAGAQESTVLPDYDRIRASGNVNISLHQADRFSFYTDATTEEKKDIEAYVENRTLFLKGKAKLKNIDVKVYFKDLKSIELQGVVKAEAPDTLNLTLLQIKADGVSKVKFMVNAEQIKASADGASEIVLSGNCSSFNADANGAASVKAAGLKAKETTASADGAASVVVFASGKINAQSNGTGSVKFYGNPEYRNISAQGLGSIKDMKDGEEYSSDIISEELSKDGDTTRVKIGKKKFIIIDEDHKDKSAKKNNEDNADPKKRRTMKRVWSGFELGVNGMVTPDFGFAMKPAYKDLNTNFGRSWFIGLNLPEIDGHIIRNKLAITTGFGLKWTWMEFETNNIMRPDTNQLVFISSGNKLQENELNTFNLTVPLLLKFAPGNKKRAYKGFHFATGIILNYVATTRLKTVTNDNGFEKTTHYESDFNTNPFRVDATVRFGYDKLRFFANYSLTPYFDSSKAPDIRTFSAGMTLVAF